MNTIRELKQQEKYKNMLKRKNKEKKIYKDKNASLQFEKQKLYIALLNREQEIERLNKERENDIEYNKYLQKELAKSNNIIKEVREYFENHTFDYDDLMLIKPSDVLEILDKDSDKE